MISNSSKQLTSEDIISMENDIGYSLPTEFINKYLKFNGGVPDNAYFYVEKDEDFVEISFFIPIKYPSEKLGELEVSKSYHKLNTIGVPKNYLPFAVDWGGNYFSIDLSNSDIVLLLMDLGEFSDESVKYLTTGFENFIDSLEEEGEE